eukprot:CAMPEP_0182477108 /NCGR_PEP_ID=MMETSP1319-20130603/30359_1 /TAXON_ID=172717 /ORGANISM="Bolidomonas pacifica, Strain RCC208" /LENGTH=58 /DNA_ID=CAMNT_0024678275 /DNA_START=670 /DNA_END=843 /DNA_ORIENTATION=+
MGRRVRLERGDMREAGAKLVVFGDVLEGDGEVTDGDGEVTEGEKSSVKSLRHMCENFP